MGPPRDSTGIPARYILVTLSQNLPVDALKQKIAALTLEACGAETGDAYENVAEINADQLLHGLIGNRNLIEGLRICRQDKLAYCKQVKQLEEQLMRMERFSRQPV
jgi:hypothetical protein